jgi:carbonic anhydrase
MPAKVRVIPGPLVAIVAATVVSVALALNVSRIELNGSLIDALQLPGIPDGKWGAFVVGVLTVALIASVESLLTAVAVDRMQTRTRSNLDRELVGQGAANMVSGAVGGLPITGVIVRSSANVTAGARTRASNILHGLWVLVFALPFAGLVQQIPTAALAGLLVVIGVQLVKLTHIATARRNGDLAIYLVTVVGVVFLNLLIGVLLGLALSILLTVWRVAHAKVTAEDTGDGQWRVSIEGPCTFLSLPKLHQALEAVPAGTDVTLTLSPSYRDHASQEYLDSWQRGHEATGGTVTRTAGPQASDQQPRTLFITCTDSGVVPSAVTGRRPGDLFIVRNIGNLVPAGRMDPSVEAAITYAVRKLGVTSVVVCGHSGCTAMTELLGAQDDGADAQLGSWLAHAENARAAFGDGSHPLARSAAAEGYDTRDQLGIVNVAVQADIVAQHPLVRDPHDQGQLDVVGLFYDTSTDRVLEVTADGVAAAEELQPRRSSTNSKS